MNPVEAETARAEAGAGSASERPERRRMRTAFGWVAGGSLGLLSSHAAFVVVGDRFPREPATFVLFAVGAYAGMAVSDRLGPKRFGVMGVAAGTLLAVVLTLGVLVALAPD